jgi:HlyD family secretion protein
MKRLFILVLIAVVVLGGLAAASPQVQSWWRPDPEKKYRFATVDEGELIEVVNSTGTVQPVQNVQVGAFVSGPIQEVFVDFNSEVVEGEIMATVDQRTYKANVARDEAALANAKANVQRVEALLEQAINNERRGHALHKEKATYISQQELDQLTAERKSLEAQLAVAEATVAQAEASLSQSKTNLDFTIIRAPVSGIVTNRLVDPGQTVASQFQTPTLFYVAPDLREKVYVYAAVDEADIGLIRSAKERDQPVSFTVDAYPDLFTGKIYQVRLNPTTEQNVVTYTVVVEASNAELKLLPGMTAGLSFQIEKHDHVIKVPNSALRFFPKVDMVRQEDKALVEGREDDRERSASDAKLSAAEKAAAERNRNRRHVWVLDGKLLKAVEIVTGISDSTYTELVEGSLSPGDRLVIGLKAVGSGL